MTDNVVELPRRPADDTLPPKFAKADHAPPRPREKTLDGLGLWLKIQSVFAGASLIDATPPALLLIWERHCTAARAWGSKWLAWPRFIWGGIHTWLVAPACYFLVWATDSFPKLAITTAAIVTTLLWFPHFTITITL